jgi:hypothetical protein
MCGHQLAGSSDLAILPTSAGITALVVSAEKQNDLAASSAEEDPQLDVLGLGGSSRWAWPVPTGGLEGERRTIRKPRG